MAWSRRVLQLDCMRDKHVVNMIVVCEVYVLWSLKSRQDLRFFLSLQCQDGGLNPKIMNGNTLMQKRDS